MPDRRPSDQLSNELFIGLAGPFGQLVQHCPFDQWYS